MTDPIKDDLVERLRAALGFIERDVRVSELTDGELAHVIRFMEIERLQRELGEAREALKPFAADRLPSTKPSIIDFNKHGLRCLMSPMEVAQRNAARALSQDGVGK